MQISISHAGHAHALVPTAPQQLHRQAGVCVLAAHRAAQLRKGLHHLGPLLLCLCCLLGCQLLRQLQGQRRGAVKCCLGIMQSAFWPAYAEAASCQHSVLEASMLAAICCGYCSSGPRTQCGWSLLGLCTVTVRQLLRRLQWQQHRQLL